MTHGTNGRLGYLDSIRGLGALMVLFQHVIEYTASKGMQVPHVLTSLIASVDFGMAGVVMFFLVSGFVIPWSLNADNPHTVKAFVIKRFFRLYPAYWVSIIFAVIFGVGIGVNIDSLYQVLLNGTMIHKFLGIESVIGAYWTLHLEILFYVICAILFLLKWCELRTAFFILFFAFLGIALLAAWLRSQGFVRIPVVFPIGLSAMFFGGLFRMWLLENRRVNSKVMMILTVFFFCTLILIHKMYYQDGWGRWYLSFILAFSMFYLLVTAFRIRNRFFVYFGNISYSFYLLHSVVIGVAYKMLSSLSNMAFGFYTLLSLFLSIMAAHFAYKFVEIPSVQLGRVAVRKLDLETIQATTS